MSGGTLFTSGGKELFTDDNPAKVSLSGSVSLSSNNGVNVAVSSRGSDYDSNGSNNLLYTSNYQQAFNGSTWDRWRNNLEGVLLSANERTGAIVTPLQTNHNSKGIILILRVSALTTTSITPVIRTKNLAENTMVDYIWLPNITSAGTYRYIIYPDAEVAQPSNSAIKMPIPRSWDLYLGVPSTDKNTLSLSVYSIL